MRDTVYQGRLTPIPFDTPVMTYTDILSAFKLNELVYDDLELGDLT